MDSRDRRRFNARVRVMLLVFLAASGLAAARAFELQVRQHDELSRLAKEQYLNEVQVPARRGQIYDRYGAPLAVSVDVPSVFANPSAVADPRRAARALAPVLELGLDAVYQKLAEDRYFVWLKRRVSPEVAAKIKELGINGIGITTESRRFYPNREIAAQVLGFTGVDGHGLEGIEKSLDDELTGEPQVVAVERDARGRAVLSEGLDPDKRTSGADVRLTIDLQLQHAAEVALLRAVKKSHAKSATAVVLDVETGEVLAMAVAPEFNPNMPSDSSPERRRNRAVTDMYEPGSTMKPIAVAAALDARVTRPDAVFFCENGSMKIGTHTIRDTHPHGWLSLTGIIQKSSNIGAAKVGQLLGRERLWSALRGFGFGERSGGGFPGEVAGMLREPRAWSEVAVSTISYGHGVAVTTLQMAAAYRALAKDGEYRTPSMILGVRDSVVRQALGADAVRRVVPMMESVVSADGTGQLAAVDGFRVAGKTGTAQKIDPVAGGYSSDKFVAVFAGFLPVDAPRAVVVVEVDEPDGDHTGGLVAAPAFAEIGAVAMRQLGVVPAFKLAATTSPKPEPVLVAEAAVEAPAREGPAAAPGAVPSFFGLTAREVVDVFASMGQGLDLQIEGSGRVVRQDPAPGSNRAQAFRVSLVLADGAL